MTQNQLQFCSHFFITLSGQPFVVFALTLIRKHLTVEGYCFSSLHKGLTAAPHCTPLMWSGVKVSLNASYKFTNHGNQFWTTKKFHIKVQLRATSILP